MTIIEKSGLIIGRISFVLAVLSFYPSIAPFTPAILISIFSFFGAITGGLFGERRLVILTIYIVVSTFLVSPISKWIENYIPLGLLVIGLVILGFIIAMFLNININFKRNGYRK